MASMTISQALQMALQHHQAGQLREAEPIYRQILQHDPNHHVALNLLGALAHQVGEHAAGVEVLRKAIAIAPREAGYRSNLAMALAATGDLASAIAELRLAIQLKPDLSDAYCNLGMLLHQTRKYAESVQASRKAIALREAYPEACNNLGNALSALQQFDEASAAYESAIRFGNGFLQARCNLAKMCCDRGMFDEAMSRSQAILREFPGQIDAQLVLADAYRGTGQPGRSIEVLKRVLSLHPSAEAHNALAVAYWEEGSLDQAIDACRAAISLQPLYPLPYSNLGSTLCDMGQVDPAIEAYRQYLTLDPASAKVHSNLVYALCFSPTQCEMHKMTAELREWNRAHAQPLKDMIPQHANKPGAHRKLKIGCVSAELWNHTTALFTTTLFENYDRSRFELICYSNLGRSDFVTEKIRGAVDGWRPIAHLSDSAVAEMIRDDGIDILLDLTQHMANNRLSVFARKPAPVQISWIAYPMSTGVAAIDYRITDPYLEPPGMFDHYYPEKLLRLANCYWCFNPTGMIVPVNDLPAFCTGSITFGCLNAFWKINDETLKLWAKVMSAVPRSRLIMVSKAGSHRQRTIQRLAELGIEPHRVEIRDRVPRRQYLELHHQIDIALDTIPYPGHTTTIDALWMGVPAVTLVGATPLGRGGVSILVNAGFPELIATSQDEYLSKITTLASDLSVLAGLRAALRPRVETSPLMDQTRFTRDFEALLLTAWREWCSTRVGEHRSDYHVQ